MTIEVIDKGRCTAEHPVPLLFVHGAWHAAWCWDEHFLNFFVRRGFRAVAVSLRGHGESTLSKPLSKCSIADYLDDVREVADTLGGQPVLIGHSMGGFIVQKYLEDRRAPAAVLLASMPSQVARRAAVAVRILLRGPGVTIRAFTIGRPDDVVTTPRLAHKHFFCQHTPESIVISCAARLQPESPKAAGLTHLSKPAGVGTPLLVLGGREDATVTNGDVRATARAHRAEAEFFPRMGHNMMLEPGWADVAERIHGWLRDHGV